MNRKIIERIDLLASSGEPFLFVIDYLGEEAIVEPLADVSASDILFDFNGVGNVGQRERPLPGRLDWRIQMPSFECYRRSFETVKHHIMAGNSYLANLTCAVPVQTNWSLKDIFHASQAKYRLWVNDRFVCFSPETFVRIGEGRILSFPMKGTIDAAIPDAENTLLADRKEAAEHATIVDLIRNDLSRVATDVRVDRYRYLDRLDTHRGSILQTSSQISGRLPSGYECRLGRLLDALLPAGSITGAPKPKTMDIIAEAEDYRRGFYTGVMGIYGDGCLDSAVMIRFVERQGPSLVYKAGGGITAKSVCEKEYDEVRQKVYVPICRDCQD